jgi:hypothetical protein
VVVVLLRGKKEVSPRHSLFDVSERTNDVKQNKNVQDDGRRKIGSKSKKRRKEVKAAAAAEVIK